MDIGKLIRKYRKNRKLTMKQLGDKINKSEAAVSQYETSKREPDLNTLKDIADALQVPFSTFFGEEQHLPEELEGRVDWIAFGEEMEERNLTPEEIKEILDFMEKRFKK
ncbi:helix-turn-helix domain-containing protein [Pseudalkalibacillus caeni]|uniref:Helix-turn-helix transcriptional regulator n=1 Tax=Exobacillus caeni TaxID=2574798 RepID=A0A5R9FB48_9BACL|nr:helix-turn-helix transcriptional regulator [Pseudalkalibacillus caeni]TLS37774.1 helix-turn-helix transcriptional regulator [Pseudalkalibacillus caeni]